MSLDAMTNISRADIILKSYALSNLKPRFFKFGVPQSDDTIDRVSALGTPVFAPLTIFKGSYIQSDGTQVDYDGFEEGDTEFHALDLALIEVSMAKNIIKTAVAGRNGTIKEYISDGDFSVTIRGALYTEQPNQFPLALVQRMKQICSVPDAISVYSPFLDLFSINSLVIESYSFPQIQASYNMQPFEIKCISDSPVEFKIRTE
tara:strand:+ start:2921 stop:3532 length:612 start_codon:yes stop_codon:yes gene_type:complete